MEMKYKKINEFKYDLKFSLEHGFDEFINKFYLEVFPWLESIEIVDNIELQKKGIDKILKFENKKEILIDEKKRRKDYGDILLEEYSNYEKKIVGWLGKEKYTDYISYIVIPSKKIFLFPFLLLQSAWVKNYESWLDLYDRKLAPNPGYYTSNIPVPKDVLINALNKEMEKQFIL